MAIWWIDNPIEIEVKGNGATIVLTSGGERQSYQMSRHILRCLVERGVRKLSKAEAKDASVIIEMARR